MKLIIILTIFITSYLIYYLFYNPTGSGEQNSSIRVDEVHNYEKITPTTSHPTPIPQISTPTTTSKRILTLDELAQKKATVNKPVIKDYLSLGDIKKRIKQHPSKNSQTQYTTYQKEIFLELKKLLQNASNTYYAKNSIVLNSHMISILPTRESQEKFKSLFIKQFGYDRATIDAVYNKNRTVWDWVMFLTNP